jgi:hypothetical protein
MRPLYPPAGQWLMLTSNNRLIYYLDGTTARCNRGYLAMVHESDGGPTGNTILRHPDGRESSWAVLMASCWEPVELDKLTDEQRLLAVKAMVAYSGN